MIDTKLRILVVFVLINSFIERCDGDPMDHYQPRSEEDLYEFQEQAGSGVRFFDFSSESQFDLGRITVEVGEVFGFLFPYYSNNIHWILLHPPSEQYLHIEYDGSDPGYSGIYREGPRTFARMTFQSHHRGELELFFVLSTRANRTRFLKDRKNRQMKGKYGDATIEEYLEEFTERSMRKIVVEVTDLHRREDL